MAKVIRYGDKRTFNGERYEFESWHWYKPIAKDEAKKHRAKGHLARITLESSASLGGGRYPTTRDIWVVWVKKGKKRNV